MDDPILNPTPSDQLITPEMSKVMKSCAVLASCVVVIGALIMNANAGDKDDQLPFGDLGTGNPSQTTQQQPQVQGVQADSVGPNRPVSAAPEMTSTPSPTVVPTDSPTPTPTPNPTSAPNPTSTPTNTPTLTPTETPTPTVFPTVTISPTPTI